MSKEYRGYPKRRICWPDPSATCLHGGCGYCNDSPFRSVSSIRNWARTAGPRYHLGNGAEEDAWDAFLVGERAGFYNAETKGV